MPAVQRTAPFLLATALATSACVSAPRQVDPADQNRVTAEELARSNSRNVFEALEKIRPQWLTSRGPTSVTDPTPTRPNVYMNGSRVGDLDFLREVYIIDVAELRFWTAGEAGARFGMGNPRGVIEIIRK